MPIKLAFLSLSYLLGGVSCLATVLGLRQVAALIGIQVALIVIVRRVLIRMTLLPLVISFALFVAIATILVVIVWCGLMGPVTNKFPLAVLGNVALWIVLWQWFVFHRCIQTHRAGGAAPARRLSNTEQVFVLGFPVALSMLLGVTHAATNSGASNFHEQLQDFALVVMPGILVGVFLVIPCWAVSSALEQDLPTDILPRQEEGKEL